MTRLPFAILLLALPGLLSAESVLYARFRDAVDIMQEAPRPAIEAPALRAVRHIVAGGALEGSAQELSARFEEAFSRLGKPLGVEELGCRRLRWSEVGWWVVSCRKGALWVRTVVAIDGADKVVGRFDVEEVPEGLIPREILLAPPSSR